MAGSAGDKSLDGSRIVQQDVMRTVAICTVAICHSAELAYSVNPLEVPASHAMSLAVQGTLSSSEWLFFLIAFTVGRLGVPLFLFLTGYFLLNRRYGSEDCIAFWKTKLLPLLLTTWIWIVLYEIYGCSMGDYSFSPVLLLKRLLFLDTQLFGHFWYMPMILGFYLTIPLFANALNALPKRAVLVPLAAVLAYYAFVPTTSVVLEILGKSAVAPRIDSGFSGGLYGAYLIVGWLFAKAEKPQHPLVSFSAFMALFLACVGFQAWAYSAGRAYNIWYSNILLLGCGVALFGFLSSLDVPKGFEGLATAVSKHSFGMFLLHYPIVQLLCGYMRSMGVGRPLTSIMAFSIAFAVSFAMVALVSKVPVIGRLLFYERGGAVRDQPFAERRNDVNLQ